MRVLYVARTLAADAVRFPIFGTSLGGQEQFGPALGSRGMADGCAFDAEGNLWVTLVLANKIVAVSPDGRVTVVIEDADRKLLNCPTSIAWGGADMCDVYIGSLATPYVLKGRSSVPGMPMVHQR